MKIVLTGSSTGIGHALATHLLNAGHDVWGIARSVQLELSRDFHQTFRSTQADISYWEQVEKAAACVALTWSHVDGLIACAGMQGEVGPGMHADPKRWSETLRANLDGTYYTLRAFYDLLRKSPRRSKVIAFSGGGSTKARVNFSAYGVAKTGIVRLVETLAEELRDEPIDLNAIAPGAINTRLTDEVIALGPKIAGPSEYAAALKQKASGGASMDKVAGLVSWLLSEESDGISGRLISAPWDPWSTLQRNRDALKTSDIYMLRRIVPEDRGLNFS